MTAPDLDIVARLTRQCALGQPAMGEDIAPGFTDDILADLRDAADTITALRAANARLAADANADTVRQLREQIEALRPNGRDR